MRNLRAFGPGLLLLAPGALLGCHDADGSAGSHDDSMIADHPYGEFFEASAETMASCARRSCVEGPNLVSPEGGGGGYACEDWFNEVLVTNCGDRRTDGAFTVAIFEGDQVDPAQVMGESAEVPAGLLPGWAVWIDITIPAARWPEADPSELPMFDQVQYIDPHEGVGECNEEDNLLPVGGIATNCADR